ncbi:peptidyl-prolyl cis-trans isomerase FKBP4 [Zootermopsis nevadensis]|uniref:FK506-binding protein 4 n=1 Tax=Zootermopsis nevadensis TaxID=136037 RepID=A0A067RVR2_ZOONE|nr:peptidyl-prolyl cis-trans isomerase FKBP4 [Zootermopsis nevadensis]KDR23964.1 FK506-binding protein 4 [Zootermopsis nevadensis]
MVNSQSILCHKEIITQGVWGDRPREGGKCTVIIDDIVTENIALDEVQHATMSIYLGLEFNGSLIIGDSDTDIDRSLERCIQAMLHMEVSMIILTFPPKLCSETSLKTRTVKCKVHLKEIHNEPYIFEWNDSKKYELAMYHKVRGVELYRCGRTRDAFLRFSKAIKFLITIIPVEDYTSAVQRDDVMSLRVILCNNIASCQLQYKNYCHVIKMCNKVLFLEPNNVKALFRRAVAYMGSQEFDKAKEDLNRVQQLEPGNAAAREKLRELKQWQRESDAKLAASIKKMFS